MLIFCSALSEICLECSNFSQISDIEIRKFSDNIQNKISKKFIYVSAKNLHEGELPLPNSPFFFHFFSRPFSPLKWLFEEAWSTEIHYVLYTYWSIAIHIALRPKASIPWNYMYFLDHTMKEIKGTYNNKTTYKFRRK